MRRPALGAAVGVLVVLLAGLGFLALRASKGREVDHVRLGILATKPIGVLEPGKEACQRPIDLDRRVTWLGLALDTGGKPGPPTTVEVRQAETGRVLTSQELPPGYVMGIPNYFGLELPRPVAADQSIAVCARNHGRKPLTLVGNESVMTQAAYLGSAPFDGDWAVFFPLAEQEPRTHLEMVPDLVRRASVMRPDIVTPATYGLLAALLLLGCPLLLWRAVSRAAADDPDG